MKELNISYITGLVLRAKANDSDAFAELYAMTYNMVYNYARHYLKDDYLAQDALQEIYILALKNLNQLNDPTVFVAWLKQISFHVCYDISQKSQKHNGEFMETVIWELLEDKHFNLEENYQRKDEINRVNQALDELPFNEKQVLVMRFFNNMKLEEIAAAMSISRSSVKRYIASGQEHLKKILSR